jgi:hypothetical protein
MGIHYSFMPFFFSGNSIHSQVQREKIKASKEKPRNLSAKNAQIHVLDKKWKVNQWGRLLVCLHS